jgi:hypothetical protein
MAPHSTEQDWRCIAQEASTETDPAKLMTLITRLCDALDRRRGRKTEFQPQQDNQSESLPDVTWQRAE